MVELGERARFTFEPLEASRVGREVFRQRLDRHAAIESGVAGEEHHADAAAAEFAFHLVRSDAIDQGAAC